MKILQNLMDRQTSWSDATFNNGVFSYSRSFPISIELQKASKKLSESIQLFLDNPDDLKALDVRSKLSQTLLIYLDCVSHLGISVDSLMLYVEAEYLKNTSTKKPSRKR